MQMQPDSLTVSTAYCIREQDSGIKNQVSARSTSGAALLRCLLAVPFPAVLQCFGEKGKEQQLQQTAAT